MKHLIRKQVINLTLEAGQNAFSIQQQVRDYYYHQITPALEKIFNELSSDDEIVQIDKLEIDLGDLGWKNDHFTLDEEAIYRKLKQTFAKKISASAISSDSPISVNYRTPEESTCLQWLYYLEKGVLPWEVQLMDAKWHDKVLHQLAIDHVMVDRTRKMMIYDPWFLARLVREHPEGFLHKLAEVITAKHLPGLTEKVITLAKQSGENIVGTPKTQKEIWEQVLKQYASGKSEPDLQEILLLEKIKEPAFTDRPDKEMFPEGMFCQYAGLVLLHPFFSHLFTHLLLLDDGLFKNAACREKAVVLLYFVVTGNTEAKDYELVIPKIICGFHLHEVISEESLILSEAERGETINMIHAAIDQWNIIRNTSVEGLRESFLAREGKVLIKENGIEFRIDTKGIDVLLDQLPWNLSLIRFPWLDKLIHVEWR